MAREEALLGRFLIALVLLASLLLGALIGGGPGVLQRVLESFTRAPVAVTIPTATRTATPTRRATPRARTTPTAPAEPTGTPSRSPSAPSTREPSPITSPAPTTPPTSTVLPTEAVAPEPTIDPRPVLTVTYTGGPLNLRDSPTFDADNVIGTLGQNATARVTGRSADGLLYQIDDGTRRGWVTASPNYVQVDGDPESVPVVND